MDLIRFTSKAIIIFTAIFSIGCGKIWDSVVVGSGGNSPPVVAFCGENGIGFVQGETGTAGGSPLVYNFSGPQIAGDTNVVSVSWYNPTGTVTSITDTSGNFYQLAAGPTVSPGQTQYMYYAANIHAAAAGTNYVTVNIGGVAPTAPNIAINEYSGLDPINPLDVVGSGSGTGTAISTSPITTTNSCDVLVSGYVMDGAMTGIGAGYYMRTGPGVSDNTPLQDGLADGVGTYTSSGTQSFAGNWAIQVAAFKKINPSPPSTITVAQVGNNFTAGSAATMGALMFSPQVAGDTNIVVINWAASTGSIVTVADTNLNPYTLAVGPTVFPGVATQAIYYAKNIVGAAAGANTVTVTLTAPKSALNISVLEYAGLSTAGPFDVGIGSGGSGLALDSTSVVTNFANELIIGAEYFSSAGFNLTTGANFQIALMDAPIVSTFIEHKVVSSPGSNNATATITAGSNWLSQVAGFH